MREIHFKIIRGLSLQESTARRWWTRHKTSGDLSRRVPPKQNRVLSAEQENSIIERITENPNLTATSLAREYGVSRSVILRLFRCHGILWRPDARETHLSEDDRIYRMAFCQMLLEEWDDDKLHSIIFSDEHIFAAEIPSRSKMFGPYNVRYEPHFVQPETKSGEISNTYWGAIGCEGLCGKSINLLIHLVIIYPFIL